MLFGLASEFWFTDELQIYLIGLKSYTTGTWPYYGPDLVYTNTQIAGGLQGLLVSLPFYISKTPESPIVFLNILSFASLASLAIYISKRVDAIPKWVVWTLVMVSPWAMHYSTRVVNPSYVLVFAVPFFIALLEALPIYKEKILTKKWAFLILGLTTALIMQLHMSWVLMVPLAGLAFLMNVKHAFLEQLKTVGLYLLGILLGALTLIPTLMLENTGDPSAASNIVFNIQNWSNLPIIVLRFFSFAANELPYVMGSNTETRLAVVKDQWWMTPAVVFLLIAGFAQVGLFVFNLFRKSQKEEFKKIKTLVILSLILLYLSFFFSIKGPASHTFYIMFPLALFYSFYCYDTLIVAKPFTLKILKIIAIAGLAFHFGLGLYNLKNKSLYKNRAKVVKALDEKDYKILGERRADKWGYGY